MSSGPTAERRGVSWFVVVIVALVSFVCGGLVVAGVFGPAAVRTARREVIREAERRAIPVALPKASNGEDITTTLALTLTRQGDLYLDGRPASEADVVRAIESARRGNREIRAVIAADKEVNHARVVQIVDLVKQNGVSRFAINIETE